MKLIHTSQASLNIAWHGHPSSLATTTALVKAVPKPLLNMIPPLASRTIGGKNTAGDGGVQAVGEHCASLPSLTGDCSSSNGGEGSAQATAQSCPPLASLTIGDCNIIGAAVPRPLHYTKLTNRLTQ